MSFSSFALNPVIYISASFRFNSSVSKYFTAIFDLLLYAVSIFNHLGETEKETAAREIKEETGLDVDIKKDFREISDYCPFGKIRKHVVFFLAQAFTDDVKIQEEEIAEYIWVDFQQARKICSYDNDLRIIEKAETAVKLIK